MRSLEAIDKDLAAARETLTHVEGTPTEVYSRIVGYYRSVRNWNKGKREEYGERKLYRINAGELTYLSAEKASLGSGKTQQTHSPVSAEPAASAISAGDEARLLLFVRTSCPACPQAKTAAGQLGIPIDLVNADTEDGIARAAEHQVFATPTAILFSREGRELERAWDSQGIAALDRLVAV
ncbi:anaerobic ribonucleoside-triphosphate reductase [Leadbettera azotonutricia]|uniref:anaerobic ribonucleoside-triphosphate reductase n=1 Tax=Leadbettera azotonutricia TaxID=150829 RepID=UPI0002E47546|nr:anaerobic ribonucleoside-triphosphate reductase [Leadbettera azotonutricia]